MVLIPLVVYHLNPIVGPYWHPSFLIILQDTFLNEHLILFRQLIILLCHHARCIVAVLCDFLQADHERGDLDVLALLGGLYSEEGGTPIYVQECVHHEILLLVYEALSELLQLSHGGVSLLLE